VVGFLNSLRESDRPNLQAAFRRGLGEAGYVDGKNVTIEYRYADNQHNRLPALAADLVSRKVAVIAATGGGASILAAMAATKTIPIVFTTGGDAVHQGYVASLNQPGGNVTGVSWFSNLIAGKGLGLLHELLPNAVVVAMLLNPKLPESARMQSEGHEVARELGQQLLGSQCQLGERDRCRVRHNARTARRRASYRGRSFLIQPIPADCCLGGA